MMLDRPIEALAQQRALARDPATTPFALTISAQWLAYFGDPEAALGALRTVYQRGGAGPVLAGRNFWPRVHGETRKLPAFKQLVRDVGMVDYWRKYGWPDLCKPVGETDFECN